MNLRKGLGEVAYGMLFVLIAVNITISGFTICITPDFIGSFLFFLAYRHLGKFTEGHETMLIIPAITTVSGFICWMMGMVAPTIDIVFLELFTNLLLSIYLFLLFGILIKIAHDHESRFESVFTFLRVWTVVVYVTLYVFALRAVKYSTFFVTLVSLSAVALLFTAVLIVVAVFKMRDEITQ